MKADAEKFWNDVAGDFRTACGYGIPTPEEARTTAAAAKEVPLSDQEIDAIVTSVVSGERALLNGGGCGMAKDTNHDKGHHEGSAPQAGRPAETTPKAPFTPGRFGERKDSAGKPSESQGTWRFAPNLPEGQTGSEARPFAGPTDGVLQAAEGLTGGANHAPDASESGSSPDAARARSAAEPRDPRIPEIWVGQVRVEPEVILFKKYRVERFLGGGAMGSVWLVRHLQLDAQRALKLIIPEIAFDPKVRKRFEREAKLMAKLSHPNAATVHDAEVSKKYSYAFIAMEYVSGGTLTHRLEPGVPLGVELVAHYLVQLCDVVHEAHKLGIVHRDLKPSNLMLVKDRKKGCEVLKVIDFGIAKIFDTGQRTHGDPGSGSLSIAFTPYYASPEQINSGKIDGRSDIYSIGVILYEMLTGFHPFGGDRVLYDHLCTPPPPMAEKNPRAGVPLAIEQVVTRCLAKDPAKRPQTASEVAAAFLEALVITPPPPPPPPPPETGSMVDWWEAFAKEGGRSVAFTWDGGSEAPDHLQTPGGEGWAPGEPKQSGPFVAIPSGPCRLGADPAGFEQLQRQAKAEGGDVRWLADPEPRQIDIPGFEIGRTPVTVDEYLRFEQATGYRTEWKERPDPGSEGRLPVVNVTFDDAEAFCEWAGARLPSAAEWEKAARGEQGRVYPWGDTFDPVRCACLESGARGRTPVDAHPASASPYGVLDCVGNVGELVDAGKGTKKLVRGGAFNDNGAYHGALWAKAWFVEPNVRAPNIGFRIARGGPAPHGPLPTPAPFVLVAGQVIQGCDPAVVHRLKARFPLGDSVVATWLADPLHTVNLTPFVIGVHAVTNEEYWEFVLATGHPQPSHWKPAPLWSGRPFLAKYAAHPVVEVTHADALAYCRWRSAREGRPYELPTRERWQAAARGPLFRCFPWGDEYRPDLCNGGEAHLGRTTDVRDCPEGDSPSGCRQMTGNVFEWLADVKDKNRSMRGGAFDSACEVYGLTFFEMTVPATHKATDVGFRVVRT
jgi:eukaryotic-like serine/threonine-protein kinase